LCMLLCGTPQLSPCSRSSSPLDSTLFAASGIRSRMHVFASVASNAVTDCHGPSRQGNGLGGPVRTGRLAMVASTCGRGLGWALAFSGLPAPAAPPPPYVRAQRRLLARGWPAQCHLPTPVAPPRLLPRHIHARLEAVAAHSRAQPLPPSLAGRIPTHDLFLKKTVTPSDVGKLNQRHLRGGR
jgi:hypothetical protein